MIVVREPPDLFVEAAEHIAGLMNRARGSCSIALAGGNTPRPVYALLAKPPLGDRVDWSRVSVFWGDERGVPPDDKDSNYGMARDALLDHVPVPAAQVHRMEAERADRDAAARAYERLLPDPLDILVLGVGPDGHTASLFPGSPVLRETERRVVPVDGPKPPPRRMTITPPVIRAAREIVVIATGADKAGVIARAVQGPEEPLVYPIQLARRAAWFVDGAAAGQLE